MSPNILNNKAHHKQRRKPVWWFESLLLYWLTLVGYIPSHQIRRILYRWEGIIIGSQSTIHWRCRFFHPKGITIGANKIIGKDSVFVGRRGITIGNCVITGSEIAIYTLQHNVDDPYFSVEGGPVIIEDYVYLGTRAIILPGVNLGYGAVVMAGAVVTHDVPAYHIVGGVPARFVRKRNRDLRYKPIFEKPFQ
jgi:acetyltransferase-like isoleucine patch superfamily enzyme